MKKAKKILGLLLAMMMMMSVAITAMAEETYSITINNSAERHTYEAYQIFTGDLSGSILSNIKWGSSVSEEGQGNLGDAAQKAETIAMAEDAAEFAEEVAPYLTEPSGSTNTVASGKYVISGLDPGYYLVKDKDQSLSGNDSYTKYILEVVKNVEVDPKATGTPTVEKKVKDINDSVDGAIDDNAWQDSADHDINDHVPFQLTATLPSNLSSYNTYKLVFHDTLSAGLTYDGDATVVVKVNGTTINSGYTITTTKNGDGSTALTITINDVKSLGATNGSTITVEYTATLNGNAVIGAKGNPNEVYLEYSNNPNTGGEGNTGTTPPDKVIVFTYKTIINKIDKDGNALAGAAFTLYKKNSSDEWVVVKKFEANDTTTKFEFTGLDDGEYKLVESTTPSGYNTIKDIVFKIVATHTDGDEPVLETLNGEKISGEIDFTVVETEGSLNADVVNNKGSELPSTGGMGTTIFYVLGAILVLGAAIMLISKKRMSCEK